jgi:hypothetical protein
MGMNASELHIAPPTVTQADVTELLSRSTKANSPVTLLDETEVGRPPRRRRPRETIPVSEEDKHLDPEELQRKKNRVAAQRSRIRAQQRTADLEEMVRELWKRVQYLEGVILTLRPDATGIYSQYEPYAVSHNLQPQGIQPARAVDLSELEWILRPDENEGDVNM